ncbi:hypothetical protein H4S06_005144, partial [Coemansia sp. BCRC 34490]
MIPDEKKPIPWGLPPLRSEVIAKQQQEEETGAAAIKVVDNEKAQQLDKAVDQQNTGAPSSKKSVDGGCYYEHGSGADGYTALG